MRSRRGGHGAWRHTRQRREVVRLSEKRASAILRVSTRSPNGKGDDRAVRASATYLDIILAYRFFVPEGFQLPDVNVRRSEVPEGRVDRRDAGGGSVGEAQRDVHHLLSVGEGKAAVQKHTPPR